MFAQRPELCFAVSTEAESGRQQGVLSEHREGGGGMDSLIEIPLSFTIQAVSMEGAKVVLTAEDGRVLAAEPEQFGFRHLIREQNNPDYEAQLEREFLSIPTKCQGEADLYRDEFVEMLPAVNPRLQRLDSYLRAAAAYLWESGSEEEREALEPESFRNMLRLASVNFSYYGDLELWLGEKDEGGMLFDGYSPTVYFDRNNKIIGLTMNG